MTQDQMRQVLAALDSSRVMARDEHGHYTREVTPKVIADAIKIMQSAVDAPEQEPVAWAKFADNGNIRLWSANKALTDEEVKAFQPLYSAPQERKAFDLLVITTAYEQGVGKGIKRDNFNPYLKGTDAHAAWKLGYEEGAGKPAPQERKPKVKPCNPLCESCVKRGYGFCADAVKTTPIPAPQERKPQKPADWVWECNECGAQEYNGSIDEEDVHELRCSSCGSNEWHLEAPTKDTQ